MKKDKQKNIIIGVLSVLVVVIAIITILSLTGTINLKGNSTVNPKDNVSENNKRNESTNLPEWANYLLKQNIISITYETGIVDANEKCAPAKTLTKEQLKDVLVKMTEAKLKKYDAGGFGGPCYAGITVKYDNKQFSIYMSKYIVADDNDSNIIALLEKESYTLDNKIITEEPMWTYEYDWDTSYIDTLV